MADVKPLPGIRYAEDTNLAELVTPPYDVISPEAQTRFYERHPENIIRLELGREELGDDDLNNRYSRAAVTFAEWRRRGVLRQDSPSFYLYQQRFSIGKAAYQRLCLLARVRLLPWSAGVILPHERTLSKPKDDRLRLLEACSANLSPIMALYDDPDGDLGQFLSRFAETAPLAEFQDDAHESHQLWRITDDRVTGRVADFFRERQLYIADGHHRYETSCTYMTRQARLRKDAIPGDDPINFVLMALCALEDPGLVVLPTHRILYDLDPVRVAALDEQLAHYFTIEYIAGRPAANTLLTRLAKAGANGAASAVLVRPTDALLLTLSPDGQKAMEGLEGEEGQESKAWRELDLATLHELVLWRGLGISSEMVGAGEHVSYTREASLAVAAPRKADRKAGATTVGLLVRSTPPVAVRDVARAGDRMPQKSTYFYPKLMTGLVINPLW
jgi:uncharacterized protein (DUF1015 family)